MLIRKPSRKSIYYPIISIRLKSKVLVNQVGQFLSKKGFIVNVIEDELRVDKRGYKDTMISSIIISGRKNLDLWMGFVSFRNNKHLEKYRKYIKSLK